MTGPSRLADSEEEVRCKRETAMHDTHRFLSASLHGWPAFVWVQVQSQGPLVTIFRPSPWSKHPLLIFNKCNWLAVWKFFIFSIRNFIIPTVTHSIIFQRGRYSTNQLNSPMNNGSLDVSGGCFIWTAGSDRERASRLHQQFNSWNKHDNTWMNDTNRYLFFVYNTYKML